ncbi:hypothetical protein QTV49_004287 [Vibrio vulnificus]|nr:hypothetical protein [Vibrio vulnificus]
MLNDLEKELALLWWQSVKKKPLRFIESFLAMTALVVTMEVAFSYILSYLTSFFAIKFLFSILVAGLGIRIYYSRLFTNDETPILSYITSADFSWIYRKSTLLFCLALLIFTLGLEYSAFVGATLAAENIDHDGIKVSVTGYYIFALVSASAMVIGGSWIYHLNGSKMFFMLIGLLPSFFYTNEICETTLNKGYTKACMKFGAMVNIPLFFAITFLADTTFTIEATIITTSMISSVIVSHATGNRPKQEEKIAKGKLAMQF